ncbi:MAG TPA: hypothetical protein VFB66_24225 [Tepidisphaeraceae bacterium]|nr:hypothetical protein [Tepidisphaeraceae bacterium]
MAAKVIWIRYREIAEQRGNDPAGLPGLADAAADSPQEHEEQIAAYLERAPNYSAMGKVVFDALGPTCDKILFPATNTDGLYLWPAELAYYVRKYHVRLPQHFLDRMRSFNWTPPCESEINFANLDVGLATGQSGSGQAQSLGPQDV